MEDDVGLELASHSTGAILEEVTADEISEVAIYAVTYLGRELLKA